MSLPDTSFVKLILNSVADGVFTVDNDWRITSFNRAAERILGTTAEQALGRKCFEIFRADICESRCALRETVKTGKAFVDRQAKLLDSRGGSVPVSLSTSVLRDGAGTLIGAVETFRDLSTLERLRREATSRYTFDDIVGKSDAFQRIFSLLPDVAESDATVLIEGPSGTGKELIAKAVHNMSRRSDRPYVVINCGALPETLFESEVFGYLKGAFTDARRDKPGRIEAAQGGTVFLDEVGELAPSTQVKLLRLLQEHQYEALGSNLPRRADIRVVAATNKRLADLVSEGRFRDDLYFRLAVVRFSIPPLRERREDIPYLVDHFLERYRVKTGKPIAGLTTDALELLLRYDFPGNARELENIIEYGFVLCRNSHICVRHLPEYLRGTRVDAPAGEPEQARPRIEQVEAEIIRSTLQQSRGVVSRCAEILGVSRTTLWRKMKKFQISYQTFR